MQITIEGINTQGNRVRSKFTVRREGCSGYGGQECLLVTDSKDRYYSYYPAWGSLMGKYKAVRSECSIIQ